MRLGQSCSTSLPRAVSLGPVTQTWKALVAAILGVFLACATGSAVAEESAAHLSKDAHAALATLYSEVPAAKALGEKAKAILVFPSITKAGLVVGGQYGEGVLIRGGKTAGYYSSGGASIGLQAGVQKYGYAMFFMTDAAYQAFDKVEGYEVGVGPNVVVVDAGMAKNLTTATMKDDIYAFVFGQKGLMAGIGLQGTKITKIDKK